MTSRNNFCLGNLFALQFFAEVMITVAFDSIRPISDYLGWLTGVPPNAACTKKTPDGTESGSIFPHWLFCVQVCGVWAVLRKVASDARRTSGMHHLWNFVCFVLFWICDEITNTFSAGDSEAGWLKVTHRYSVGSVPVQFVLSVFISCHERWHVKTWMSEACLVWKNNH